MIQHDFDSIHNGIYESLGNEVYQQDIKIYAPINTQITRIWRALCNGAT